MRRLALRRRISGSKGQSTVEMALVLPLLIWLLLGLVDMALLANAYVLIMNGAREGVRLGLTGASDSAVVQRVKDTSVGLDPARLTISVSPAGARNSGSDIAVQVDYRYKVLALMGIIGTDVPLTTKLIGRVE